MSVKLLTEHNLEFLSSKGGCTGSSGSTPVKMPHCWKSHVTAQMFYRKREHWNSQSEDNTANEANTLTRRLICMRGLAVKHSVTLTCTTGELKRIVREALHTSINLLT